LEFKSGVFFDNILPSIVITLNYVAILGSASDGLLLIAQN